MPTCGTAPSTSAVGFAVPMSNPRYSCRESALTTVRSAWRANHSAAKVLPAPVGPQMTRIGSLLSSKATLELGPRQLHDGRAAVHVVRRKRRLAQRDVQRAHL